MKHRWPIVVICILSVAVCVLGAAACVLGVLYWEAVAGWRQAEKFPDSAVRAKEREAEKDRRIETLERENAEFRKRAAAAPSDPAQLKALEPPDLGKDHLTFPVIIEP